jgi:methylenetetrahydrofolate reductase (NADPH)
MEGKSRSTTLLMAYLIKCQNENTNSAYKILKSKRQLTMPNLGFMYKLREAGVTVPVVPGIMPITNANQVERAIKLSGAFMPQRFKAMVDKFGSDPVAMRQAGIAYATNQIIDLYANGITNVHVYSMNKPDVAKGIYDNLTDILGKKF